MPDGQELIYSPAQQGDEGYLIAIAGETGSGKTLSALRLARGIAGPDGIVAMADTENKRGLRYAGQLTFHHAPIGPPFRPEKYVAAAEGAKKLGAKVLIIDSMSHEHVGEGGVLEWFDDEMQRLAGDDYSKRERMKGVAWIAPKRAHKRMLQRLIQLNFHVIFCLRAEKKVDISVNPKTGKTEWTDLGFQPICSGDFMFDMTMSFLLSAAKPEQRGIAQPIKLDGADRHLVFLDRPLDEDMGARIARKAAGLPVDSSGKSKAGGEKSQATADQLCRQFGETVTREDHERLIGTEKVQTQIRWLREKRPELFPPVNAAMEASWNRVAEKPAVQQQPTGSAEDTVAAQLIQQIDDCLDVNAVNRLKTDIFFLQPYDALKAVRPDLFEQVEHTLRIKALSFTQETVR